MAHIFVPPMGFQVPSGPWVLSLDHSLGTLCFFHWLTVSLNFCICHALPEPLRRQLYQAPVSWHLLTSDRVSGFGHCNGMDLQVGQSLNGLSFSLCSTL